MLKKLMHHPLIHRLRSEKSMALSTFIVRLTTGSAFMYHGYLKLTTLPHIAAFFAHVGVPAAGFTAALVASLEFFGGLGIIIGLGTRFWALSHSIILAFAIILVKGLSSFGKFELELSLLGPSLLLLLQGAGAWSVDAVLMKERS